MVCGGFACSKNCLCALNLLYTLVSLLLIGIAAWGIGFGLISSFRVVGVAIAVGIFLFFIALVGLIGAVKHHQVLLFFSQLLEVGWNNTKSARTDLERNLNCCGFRFFDPNETCSSDCFRSHQCQPCAPIIEEYSGMVLRFVGGIGLFFSFTECSFQTIAITSARDVAPKAGPTSLLPTNIFVFSFQILGVWLTYRYRNQKDPRANPSAFL
ncbi:hypothetical protein ASZ78_008896 [Callipepla squamata]|uniref:Tetraspanin n=1 Tax=Callipepla squamata TaxID=9009 RepID=A0A226N6H3_CALSU|nr:hypothetical protein ASZ78_008896 [Callipepla squamata]